MQHISKLVVISLINKSYITHSYISKEKLVNSFEKQISYVRSKKSKLVVPLELLYCRVLSKKFTKAPTFNSKCRQKGSILPARPVEL